MAKLAVLIHGMWATPDVWRNRGWWRKPHRATLGEALWNVVAWMNGKAV